MKLLKKILRYFSEEAKQERKDNAVRNHWDKFTDEEIIDAYHDNIQWAKSLKFLKIESNSSMVVTNKYRYNNLILPQMNKRNLWEKVDVK